MYDWYLLTYEPLNRAKPSIHYQTRDQLSTSVQFSFTSVPQLLTVKFFFSTHLSIQFFFFQKAQVAIELRIPLWSLTRLCNSISVPHHVFIVPLAEMFLFLLLAFTVPLIYTPLFSAFLNIQY